ncbi:hypothetical protein D3C81_1733310 [compost metagenome]
MGLFPANTANPVFTAKTCGSGLAREGVVSVDNIAGNADAFASKPAPTRGIESTIDCVDSHHQFNEVLLKNPRRNICSIPTHKHPGAHDHETPDPPQHRFLGFRS